MSKFNIKTLYIYKFLSQCMPIYAFYTVLFMERGQSVSQIALLISLWSVFSIVFEIPSGMLADRWNRKNMLVLANILKGICFIIWFFSYNFILFALGFVFWSISGAFVSGTEESLIYDNLKSDGLEENFADVYGKANLFENIGIVVGKASAGIIVNFIGIEMISLFSAVICFLNIFFSARLRERNFYSLKVQEEKTRFFDTLKEAASFIRDSKMGLILILFLILFVSLGGYLDEFDALIIKDLNLNNFWVSVILTIRFAFISFGNLVAPILQKKIGKTKHLFIVNVCACLFLLLFSFIWNGYLVIFFGISCMLMAITEVLIVDALQKEIKDEGRSTIMSFYGVGQNIVMIIFSLLFAIAAGIFTLKHMYIMISLYGLLGSLCFYLFVSSKKM